MMRQNNRFVKMCSGAIAVLLCLGCLFGLAGCKSTYEETPFSVCRIQMAAGTTPPEAEDFVTDVRTHDGEYRVLYDQNYDFQGMASAPASYELTILFSDLHGYVQQAKVVLTVVARDTTAPVITLADTSPVTVGTAVAYRARVSVCDDCFGDVSLSCDSSAVNLKMPGTYPICYTAVDASGNVSQLNTTITVVAKDDVALDELNEKLDGVIAQIITPDMDTVEKLRAVYAYVYDAIRYTATSEKSSWISEAYHALFVSGQGDCFSYFAAAKAFCERLGIENLDVQRLPGYTQDTHYWSMVNIGGEGNDAVWYHFDCCHLAAEYYHSGCLLTDKQVHAYNVARPHFYEYEKSAYPRTPDIILTPTPTLEPFYE